MSGSFTLSGDEGSPGEFLESGGPGVPAHWGTPQGVFPAGAGATVQTASPVKPSSTASFLFQGVGALLTPVRSGNLLVLCSATVVENSGAGTQGNGVIGQLYYEAGSAVPSNGAAVTGFTVLGAPVQYDNGTTLVGSAVFTPFNIQAMIFGLTVNTQYAFDLAAKAVQNVSVVGFANVNFTVVEL